MGGIGEILMGFGPILFSGAVFGAVLSYFGPEIIKRMKKNFAEKRVLDLYDRYKRNPRQFAVSQPKLSEFFEKEGWMDCDCPNCMTMRKNIKSLSNASSSLSGAAKAAIGLKANIKEARKPELEAVEEEQEQTDKIKSFAKARRDKLNDQLNKDS